MIAPRMIAKEGEAAAGGQLRGAFARASVPLRALVHFITTLKAAMVQSASMTAGISGAATPALPASGRSMCSRCFWAASACTTGASISASMLSDFLTSVTFSSINSTTAGQVRGISSCRCLT